MLHRVLEAAAKLEEQGISVEVIDPRTISPLDTATIIRSIAKTGRLLLVEESFAPCGLGAEIAAQMAEHGFDELDAPIRRLNGLHSPTPYSPPLENAVVPGVDEITAAIKNLHEE
jgi:2-oxoisovalerate dehydrogenase E1 component